MSSVYNGRCVSLSLFGESHGPGVGVVLGGFPHGLRLDFELISGELERRRPGGVLSTQRNESDIPELISGVLDGVTTGAPICALIRNADAHSGDYSSLRDVPRPGHADYTARARYGNHHDVRGGGHFSARLTAPLVFAGAVARQLLALRGIEAFSRVARLGGVVDTTDCSCFGRKLWAALRSKAVAAFSDEAASAMEKAIMDARAAGDSVGGVVEFAVFGVPVGLGSPYFDNVESRLSQLLFAVPAVKGVAFGTGFAIADMAGSEANDAFVIEDGEVRTLTNHNGGINGGITNGMPLSAQIAFKPTPSISKPQMSVNISKNEKATLEIKGRHDPCVVLRALPVVEACAAIVLLDLLLEMEGVSCFKL